jgi:O-antigen ligase
MLLIAKLKILKRERKNYAQIFLGNILFFGYLLAYHQRPFIVFYNDWLPIFGIVIVFAFYTEQKFPQFSFPSIATLPFALALLIAIQTAFGMLGVAWDALLPIAYFLIAAMAMVLGATWSVGPHAAERVTNALALAHLAAGLLSVGIASMQFIGTEGLLGYWVMQLPHGAGQAIRPYANTGQPNQLALLFCMAIAACWWLYQAGKLRAGVVLAVVLTLLWGLALTQSRIGWLILPIFAALIWRWRGNLDFRRVSVAVLAALLLLYGILVALLPLLAALLDVTTTSAVERVGGGSERWVLMQQAWQISIAQPWFGAGWYQFGPEQLKIGADFAPSTYAQHSHNIVLNFAAELGWPVTILTFGALAWWFAVACLRRPVSKEVGFTALFLLAVLVHSLVEFPLWYAYVLMPVALLMGMVHQQQFGAAQRRVPRVAVIVLFCLMAAGLVGVATDYRRLVVGFRALGWENLGLKADEGSTDKPAFTMFPQFYDYFRFAKTLARPEMKPEEIAFMERTASRFGYAPVLMRMSLVYALNGRPGDGLRAMKTLSRLHSGAYPEAWQAWRGMAQAEPDKYGAVFAQMEKPALTLTKR